MKKTVAMRFRWFIILLVTLASAATLVVSGTAIFLIRDSAITEDMVLAADKTVNGLSERTESILASVEQSVTTLTYASILIDRDFFSSLALSSLASQPLIRAMYFLDAQGKTFAIWSRDGRNPNDPDYQGIDFSYTPLYRSLKTANEPIWSDKFVSTLAGNTFVGVGIRIGKHAAIAELELETLLDTVQTASGTDARILVVDRQGEILVDTEHRYAAGVLNILGDPIIAKALAGETLPDTVELQGTHYHPAADHSEKLGWLFFAGVPAGFENPSVQNILTDILLLSGSFLLTALLLSPLWSQVVASQVNSLRNLADRIADGEVSPDQKKGLIREFNDLSRYLRSMAERILERENTLRVLNLQLEQRVAERTKELEETNHNLRESLENNTRMRDLLVTSEKLAALGRLVAGVAHEMNTPIGNAVMAISTLKDGQRDLQKAIADGLRKSDLDKFLEHSEQGLDIAERNVDRAAELVSSFKHVARDQTSSIRRKFELSEMISEVLLTLHPMLKRSPHALRTDIEDGLNLDSYPGVIGQILTNLVTNALNHAWDNGKVGTLSVSAHRSDKDGWIRISVADDGKGIPEVMRKKVFEPFFTTRMGRGGTGLGLNIAHNGAQNVLGGDLDFECPSDGGTTFHLDIPLVAPILQSVDESDPSA